MLSYEEFGRLRLVQFVEPESVVQLRNWEFMDRIWVGEAVGFTEWLRLEDDPDVVRSVSIHLVELDSAAVEAIFARLGLPLWRGMSLSEIEILLGQPVHNERYVADRQSFLFRHGHDWPYDVNCTVHNEEGLIYVVIMAPAGTYLTF